MTSPTPRLAIVLSHPTQYYSPWFRWMASAGWTLRVFYLWNFGVTTQRDAGFGTRFQWDIDLLSGYDHEFVPNTSRQPGTHRFFGLRNPTLPDRLAAWQPDAVLLFGYRFATHQRLIFTSRWPLIFRGDSHVLGQPPPAALKRFLLSLIYARFAAVTCVGRANRGYFTTYGVPDEKLFFSPHCVNQAHFTATEEHRRAAASLKAGLGLGDRRVVLFAGKFVPNKQPRELLEAFLALAPADTALVMVGEGPERPVLESLAAARPEVAVRFLPFANQSEMPVRYLMADVFCLPSRGFAETWGLAVNEAMHLGTPCLVSDRVGCQQDLILDGQTGWVFRIGEPGALQAALARSLAESRRDAAGRRAAVIAHAARYSYAAAAAGLAQALTAVTRP